MKTYGQMHSGLHWARGKASDHACIVCGYAAVDWAYQHTAGCLEIIDERGRRYSENFADYAPMCRSCHRRFDMLQPERQAQQQEHLQRLARRIASDPVLSEKRRKAGEKGREVIRLKRAAGGSWARADAAALVELGKQVGNLRRKCTDCGLETAAGPLARHQSSKGHSGWEPA